MGFIPKPVEFIPRGVWIRHDQNAKATSATLSGPILAESLLGAKDAFCGTGQPGGAEGDKAAGALAPINAWCTVCNNRSWLKGLARKLRPSVSSSPCAAFSGVY